MRLECSWLIWRTRFLPTNDQGHWLKSVQRTVKRRLVGLWWKNILKISPMNWNWNSWVWSHCTIAMVIALAMVLIATNVFRGPVLKAHSHRAKTEAKVKISLMFVAYSLIFDGCSSIFFVFAWWEKIAQLTRSSVNENIFHIANAVAQCKRVLLRNPIFSLTFPVTI